MKKLLCMLSASALVCALCLCGCAAGSDDAGQGGDAAPSEQLTDEQLEEARLESTGAFAAEFASAALGSPEENTCISPISLYYALAMLASGVQGDAQAQILDVLGAPDATQMEDMCKRGLTELTAENDQYKLAIADSLWVSPDYRFTDSFKNTAAEDFNAEAFSVKFGTKQADNEMSKWVSDKTNGLLSPNFQTHREQIASLLNTIYFKDAWVEQFNTEETVIQTFHAADDSIAAPFMNKVQPGCGYADLGTFRLAELYFTSGSIMTFYLPAEGVALQDLIGAPDPARALLSAQPASYPDIRYSIPKFSFSTNMGDLIPVLMGMGITDVFSNPTGAAFDSMLEYTGEGAAYTPYVSDVRQETNISVAEEGVEAAAYTEVGIMKMSAVEPSQPVDFVLDRPFIFKVTAPDSTVLFAGVVLNPEN